MNISLYQAAAALNATNKWQELIAENIAFGMHPAYKKNEVSFSAIQAGLIAGNTINNYGAGTIGLIPQSGRLTNFYPGELKYTGLKTDIAIEGKGFFEIQMPNGNLVYTRNGEFKVDLTGRLVTKNGYLLMGDRGPIQIDPSKINEVTINENGEVIQGGIQKGKIKVVDFNDYRLLEQMGGSYFVANNSNIVKTEVKDQVIRQGFVEESNSIPMIEMGNLMVAMRFYEANQHLIKLHDERMEKAINELSGT